MKRFALSRLAVTISAAGVSLVGCGGLQPPTAVPAAIPQGSWLLPQAKDQKLLYASRYYDNAVSVFSYPSGRKVGELRDVARPYGLCSDTSGNVYVTSQTSSDSQPSFVYEYAPGTTSPIKTFTDETGATATGCAVDPATGSVAVTNRHAPPDGAGNVAVFQHGSESPKTYAWKDAELTFCAYDSSGNLYVSAISAQLNFTLLRLAKGAAVLRQLGLSRSIAPYSVQWVKNKLLVATATTKSRVGSIYPVKISGGAANVGAPIQLQNAFKAYGIEQYVIEGGSVVGPARTGGKGALRFWSYPRGGTPVKTVTSDSDALFYGMTVSVRGTSGENPSHR